MRSLNREDGHLHDDDEWYEQTCLWIAEQYVTGEISKGRAGRTLGHIGIDPNQLTNWVNKYNESEQS